MYHAAVSLAIFIKLILQTELPIHWNGVTGMGNTGAIPAVIGVGGLVRLVWAWKSQKCQ